VRSWVVSNTPEGELGRIMSDEDADFIAAARTLVPDLLARAQAAEAEVARLRDCLRRAMKAAKETPTDSWSAMFICSFALGEKP
jgi:hypothetical protein